MKTSINPQSPRTKEAMNRLGILELEIQPRSLASFAEENLLTEFQEMRKQHFDRRREEFSYEILKERDKIIDEILCEDKRKSNQKGVAREMIRLKKLEDAQKKELQQFIEREIKMQEITLMNEANQAKERVLEEKRALEKAEHAKEWENQRKLREDQKYQAQLEELRRQEVIAQKHFEEVQRMQKKEHEEQRKLKALAQQKAMERRRKQAQREAMLQQMLVDQERAAHERKLLLQEREKRQVEAFTQKRHQEIETHRVQAEALKARIRQAKTKEQILLAQKKRAFERKAAKPERRRARFEAERQAQIQQAIEESREHMRKVKAALQAGIENEELRKKAFDEKETAEQQHQAEIQRNHHREAQRIRELNRMQKLECIEAIQRHQRAQEYKCSKIRERIEHENKIGQAIKEKSKKLIEQRRKLAMDSKLKKEQLSSKLEHIKLNGQFKPQAILKEFGIAMPKPSTLKHPITSFPQLEIVKNKPGSDELELEEEEEISLRRCTSSALRPDRSLKELRLSLLHQSRSVPKIGPVSRNGYKRLLECGSAYDIDMSWLKKPLPARRFNPTIDKLARDEFSSLLM